MKLSKMELKEKVNAIEALDDDMKISLLEDIEDSYPDDDVVAEMQAKYDAEKAELEAQIANEKVYYEELKAKYKERFLKGEKVKEEIEEKKEEDNEGLEEKNVIDVKDIF